MPNQRKAGKKMWGGYLEPVDFERLDREAKARGFDSRTEFLSFLSRISGSLPYPDSSPEPEPEPEPGPEPEPKFLPR